LSRAVEWYRFERGGVGSGCEMVVWLEGNGVRFQKKPDEGGWWSIGSSGWQWMGGREIRVSLDAG
jgi:hypothetical protein